MHIGAAIKYDFTQNFIRIFVQKSLSTPLSSCSQHGEMEQQFASNISRITQQNIDDGIDFNQRFRIWHEAQMQVKQN